MFVRTKMEENMIKNIILFGEMKVIGEFILDVKFVQTQ
jgi:hypothetical protein